MRRSTGARPRSGCESGNTERMTIMKKSLLRAAALLLTLALLCGIVPLAAQASRFEAGANEVFLILRTPQSQYDLRTAEGLRAYILSCTSPFRHSVGDVVKDCADAVKSAEVIYTQEENRLSVVRVGIAEDKKDHTYELGVLLQQNEDVLDVSTQKTDPVGDPWVYAYGTFTSEGYSVTLRTSGLADLQKIEFRFDYNESTLQALDMNVVVNAFGGLPFYTITEKKETACRRVTVTPVAGIRITGFEDLFTLRFATRAAGDMDFAVFCLLTDAQGETQSVPVTTRLNKSIPAPYPQEYAGDMFDIFINDVSFCAIRNELFQDPAYRETLFAQAYDLYREHLQPKVLTGANETSAQGLPNREGCSRFVSVIFPSDAASDEAKDYTAYNTEKLSQIASLTKEVLYVSRTTPCAVVLTDGTKQTLDAVSAAQAVECVTDPFQRYYGDVCFGDTFGLDPEQACNSAAARMILLHCAGLKAAATEKTAFLAKDERLFYLFCDVNRDNKITSADARLMLRMATKLDDPNDYRVAFPSDWELYWNIGIFAQDA